MDKLRLGFSKQGGAVFLSHLDLMRVFARALRRAGVELGYSEGFNPHPYISIALPLPVGVSSVCELMDIRPLAPEPDIAARLNAVLPAGLSVERAYEPRRPLTAIFSVEYDIRLDLDFEPRVLEDILAELFDGRPVLVGKRRRDRVVETDIAPRILKVGLGGAPDGMCIKTLIRAENQGISPQYVYQAIHAELKRRGYNIGDPAYHRRAVYDPAGLNFS